VRPREVRFAHRYPVFLVSPHSDNPLLGSPPEKTQTTAPQPPGPLPQKPAPQISRTRRFGEKSPPVRVGSGPRRGVPYPSTTTARVIVAAQRPSMLKRFTRGARCTASGSGLGLALVAQPSRNPTAERIDLTESTAGGLSATLTLPAERRQGAEHPDPYLHHKNHPDA